jgi:hypothetical protein
LGILDWLMRRALRKSQLRQSKFVIGFDTDSLWCQPHDSTEQSLGWSELTGVSIETTDEGPFEADFFWVLRAEDGRTIRFPGGATGARELLARFQQLPGFDHEAVIAAAASTQQRIFDCWQSGTA